MGLLISTGLGKKKTNNKKNHHLVNSPVGELGRNTETSTGTGLTHDSFLSTCARSSTEGFLQHRGVLTLAVIPPAQHQGLAELTNPLHTSTGTPRRRTRNTCQMCLSSSDQRGGPDASTRRILAVPSSHILQKPLAKKKWVRPDEMVMTLLFNAF